MVLRLGERLDRLRPGVAPPEEPPLPEPEVEVLPHSVERLRSWHRMPTPYGTCLVHREELPHPGSCPLPPLQVLLRDERLEGFHLEDALFLDIEATGLSHGAGTVAFLIGVAWVDARGVVLEQIFLDDPSNEMPALGYFLDVLERHSFLVSFNGKSYDLSVLQARMIVTRLMTRRDVELKLHPHLDLLHVSRQAYKGTLENVKLQTLEREVLRIDPTARDDDVPGCLVPSLYFHYLRTGYAPPLDGVLKHNRIDVLSMVDLTAHLLRLLDDPPEDTRPAVLVNLGRAALRRKLNERAAALMQRGLDEANGELTCEARRKVLLDLVTAHRRAGAPGAALAAARRALDLTPAEDDTERGRLERQIHRFERKLAKG